jgi:hypothetical protein
MMSLSNQFLRDTFSGPPLLYVPPLQPHPYVARRTILAFRTSPSANLVGLARSPFQGYSCAMDSETLRTVADLARRRAARGCSGTHGDGMMRLGAARALTQLAVDIEVSAAELERTTGSR